MKQISLTLNDNEFQKLMDLLKSFNSVGNLQSQELKSDLPDFQQRELDQRLKSHAEGTAEYEAWENVKSSLFEKYKIE